MSHTNETMSSGICYIKNKNSLTNFLLFLNEFILEAQLGKYYGEMIALYRYYKKHPEDILILPCIFENDITDKISFENYDLFNDTVFDAACYGIYLLGEELIHNDGKLVKGKSLRHHFIYCSDYLYKFEIDKKDNLRKPYIYNNVKNKWILINNLHVHAKNLNEGLSK